MLPLHIYIAAVLLFTHHGYSQKEGESCVIEHSNTAGVCSPATSCQSAKRDYEINRTRPTFCNSGLLTLLVCCSDESSVLNTGPNISRGPVSSSNQQTTKDDWRLSEKKCEEYRSRFIKTVEYVSLLPDPEHISISVPKCDYYGVELIVGGEDAQTGEFPHMAAIGWINLEGTYSFLCDGSVISSKFILTAARCTYNSKMRDPNPVVVRLGDQNLDLTPNNDSLEIPIKKIRKHPQYKSPGKYHDIALLELASDIDFDAVIKPACLWNKPDFPGHTKAVATGWGVVDPRTLRVSNELQKVPLTLLENDYCDNLLRINKIHLRTDGLIHNQMCAVDLRGKDTCQKGNSGSPLQVIQENTCLFYLIGVKSYDDKCAQSGTPAVYTRVSSYLDWIESVVWPGES